MHVATVEPDPFLLLAALFPVRGLIHVGPVGSEQLSRYQTLEGVERLILVADPDAQRQVTSVLAASETFACNTAVVADVLGDSTYHIASNARESGLLQPETLAPLWRNLHTVSSCQVTCTTLQHLRDAGQLPRSANWLVVTTLPGPVVLRAGHEVLGACDVVQLRCAIDGIAQLPQDISVSTADDFLHGLGFRRVSLRSTVHPSVATASYVRDWQSTACRLEASLQSASIEQGHLATWVAELQTRLSSLREASELQTSAARLHGVALADAKVETERLASSLALAETHKNEAIAQLYEERARGAQREDALALARAELQAVQAQSDQLGQALEDRLAEALKQEESVVRMQAQLKQQERAIQELQGSLSKCSAGLGSVSEERDAILLSLAQAQQEAGEARQMVDKSQHALRSAQAENADLRERLSELEERHAELTTEFEEQVAIANARLATQLATTAETAEHATRLQLLSAEVQTLHEELETKDNSRRVAEERLDELRQELASSRLLYSQANARVEELIRERAGWQADRSFREAEHEKSRILAESELVAARAALDACRQELALMQQSHEPLCLRAAEADEKAAALAELQQEFDEQVGIANRRQLKIEAAVQELRELRVQMAAAEQYHSQVAKENGELKSALQTAVQLAEEAAAKSASLENDRARLQADLEARDARLAGLQKEESDQKERLRMLEEELLKSEAQIELIKDVILRDKAF